MRILKKFKLWWKSTTSAEKVCIILSGISTAAAVTGAVCSVKTRNSLKDIKVEVNLYPEKNDEPVPLKRLEKPEKEQTEYDMAAELLRTLWREDDLLLCEDYRAATSLTDGLMTYMEHPAMRIMDILNRADGDDLGQEDLFEAQDEAGALARYLAEREDRLDDFKEEFHWLSGRFEGKKEGE